MSETYELLKEIDFAFQYQINCELTPEQCKWILDWYEKWHKCQSLACKQEARIAELEAENEKIDYFFRRLRMFCIFAHWDNPNTEAEFNKVDAEIREYLSEYKENVK